MGAYPGERAHRDTSTLALHEDRARAVVHGDKPEQTPGFVTACNGSAVMDEPSLERDQRLVGVKGYVTSLEADRMPAGEVVASYHDLWHVGVSFCMSTTDLRAGPMFARTQPAIEAHLTIVSTELASAALPSTTPQGTKGR